MLSSDEQEDDVFFDSVDFLSSDEPVVAKEDIGCDKLEYQIWFKEPSSVEDRRKNFLREMGLVRFADTKQMTFHKLSGVIELERIRECSDTVSSSSSSDIGGVEDSLVCCGRDVNSEANCMVDELEHVEENKHNIAIETSDTGLSPSIVECERSELQDSSGEFMNLDVNEKQAKKWWKRFVSMKRRKSIRASDLVKSTPKTYRMKVKQNKKKCTEFTALFTGQEIQAHKGSILTMKFSPDGRYLASGGEDGVVCIWRVLSTDVSCESFLAEDDFVSDVNESKYFGGKKSCHASVVFPEKVFYVEDSPLHKFHGHSSDVLDLAWSNSIFLLSSSKDKTVRLWQVGCEFCIHVFHHSNYVTCVQFNPVDDNYFISGSIDGKVRIWGVSEKRVVDWADVRDVISAVCYQPNGNGFVVGTITGICRFYQASGQVELEAELHIQSKRKRCGKRITGIQFSQENSQRVMISSEDSKLRILDGLDVVHKFKGLPKSGSQMSASFTSTGKHIISVGEDCRVYVWNYNGFCNLSSKRTKCITTCEHFFSQGVSVAVPWSGMGAQSRSLTAALQSQTQVQDQQEGGGGGWIRDSDRFSLGSWFSIDVPSKSSATWPEEKLPLWELTTTEDELYHQNHQQHSNGLNRTSSMPDSWGLVVVTGGWDGRIRTFHNYGLPVRLH